MQRNDRSYKDLKQKQKSAIADKTYKMHLKFYLENQRMPDATENGVDQQVVQKLLGHSILAMTTDLYTHVSEEKKKEEVAELKILA